MLIFPYHFYPSIGEPLNHNQSQTHNDQRCSQDFFCKNYSEVKTFSSRPRTRLRFLPPRPSSRSKLFLQDHNQDFFLETIEKIMIFPQNNIEKANIKISAYLINFKFFQLIIWGNEVLNTRVRGIEKRT